MSHRRLIRTWRALAQRLDLEEARSASRGLPWLRGETHGIAIDVYATGRGMDPKVVHTARFPSGRSAIAVEPRQGLASGGGGLSVEIHAPEFDAAEFIIRADSEQRVRTYLTPQRRSRILTLFARFADVELEASRLTITRQLDHTDFDSIYWTTNVLVDAAMVLMGSGPPTGSEPVIQAEITDDMREHLARDVSHAALRLDTAAAAVPEPSGISSTAAEVVEAVDGSQELFDAEYRGCTVEWSGVIVSTAVSAEDLKFVDREGVKVVVGIADHGEDLYGMPDIRAVVWFHRLHQSQMEIGTRLRFRGTLTKLDLAEKTFHVADATAV